MGVIYRVRRSGVKMYAVRDGGPEIISELFKVLSCLICISIMQHVGFTQPKIQGSAKRLQPGLVNFVPALAYHFYQPCTER